MEIFERIFEENAKKINVSESKKSISDFVYGNSLLITTRIDRKKLDSLVV
jgi:hypothetical protein